MAEARVFFALWPDAATARAIDATADALGADGRRVPPNRLHLTLAFIGRADDDAIERLRRQAAAVRVPRFTLSLDRTGYFYRPRILWLGSSTVPDPLAALADAVRAMPEAPDCIRTFRPHVTLARRARPLREPRISPIEWHVAHFSLVQSGTGGAPGAYRQLGEWRLG